MKIVSVSEELVRKLLIVGVLGYVCSFAFADGMDQYVNTSWTGSFTDGFGKVINVQWQIVQGKGSLVVLAKRQVTLFPTTSEYPAKVVDGILEFCGPNGVRWATLDPDGNLAVAYDEPMTMKPGK